MGVNNLHTAEHFAYKKFHSPEMMMVGIVNDILKGFDENKCTVMLFLDLSAAFDTLATTTLLAKLKSTGITGVRLKWFNSYMSGRSQKVL